MRMQAPAPQLVGTPGRVDWSAGRLGRDNAEVYGELLGLVMVGPHVTDLVEAGVVALDAESTVETVADGSTIRAQINHFSVFQVGQVSLATDPS